jgi:Fur family transcriptional regulator, ferric uptake regulator
MWSECPGSYDHEGNNRARPRQRTMTMSTKPDATGRTIDRSDQLDTIVDRRLRHDGQRYTTQRRALIDVLAEADARLAQSSAYRNLAVLERAGVVHRIVTSDDHARWELTEDLTEHHHHLICRGCGDVTDFTVPTDIERRLDDALADAASVAGFDATHHRLDLVGLCSRCQ